jgi:uncharacterized membrane protein YhaH (DUF805 family)
MAFKDLYLSAQGRISRKVYWLRYGIPAIVIIFVAYLLDALVGSDFGKGIGICVVIAELLIIYPGIVMAIKRVHDRGKSGWFVLVCCIPVVFLWPAVEICLLKGTTGENKYGKDSLEVNKKN